MKNIFKFIILALVMAGLLSCMSVQKGLEPHQTLSEGQTYMVGQIDAGFDPSDQDHWSMRSMAGVTFMFENMDTGKGKAVQLPVLEYYLNRLPAGNYDLRSISYVLINGNQPLSYNLHIDGVELDLINESYVYLGDVQLGTGQNPYGNYQTFAAVEDNYDAVLAETDSWVVDESGTAVTPVNLSGIWDNLVIMNNPFRHKLINVAFPATKNKGFIPENGDKDFALDKSKSIAFVAGDVNSSTIGLTEFLDTYAQEQGVQVISQDKISAALPLYPANIYHSRVYDNYGTSEYYYMATEEEEYNSSVEPLIQSIGQEVGADYVYLVYYLDGVDSGEDKGLFGNNANSLFVGMRGRLMDTKTGETLGVSQIFGRNKSGFMSYQSYDERMEELYEDISAGIFKKMY